MKKFLSILLMLTCVLGLTACGGEVEKLQYDKKDISNQCAYMIFTESQEGILDEVKENPYFLNLNDDGMDVLANVFFDSYGIRTEGEVVIKAFESWENAQDDIGKVDGEFKVLLDPNIGQEQFDAFCKYVLDKSDFDLKDDELIVTVPFKGTEHDGSVEFIYDKNLHLTSVTTNIDYSLSESMQKAGMNTAIGMGTVFVMLVVIMLIIYCFGIIPKIQNASKAKKENKVNADASVDNAIKAIVEREESTDDTELVAVIAAAIAQYEGTSTDGFVVRSIRRIK